MVEVKLGAATATRIEESYEPNFEAQKFFADWTPGVVREHRDCFHGAGGLVSRFLARLG